MNDLDTQTGQYKVTAHLFNFIDHLPQDKQYILYKQLIKGSVVTELFKLIIDMDEDEKIQLLERLGEIPYEEEPIRTINLDENESFMRENTRKVCQIPVKCRNYTNTNCSRCWYSFELTLSPTPTAPSASFFMKEIRSSAWLSYKLYLKLPVIH